ncbi:integrin alpha-M-like [Siphateles boraxobius]|uniref:integrin alpha-M-like n=1 Tax=Siphateles boraxobius TaxID=180520 RepID=UPI00406452E3
MNQNFCIRLCIFCASQSVMAFNIDPVSWKNFTAPSPSQSQNVAFGYKVIQKNTSSLIVSDPLIQLIQDQRGLIYDCSVTKGTCSSLKIDVPSEAVSMSLGLSMVQDPGSSKMAFCGSTIPKKCASVTNYRGMCFLSENSVFKAPIPSSIYRVVSFGAPPDDQMSVAALEGELQSSGDEDYPLPLPPSRSVALSEADGGHPAHPAPADRYCSHTSTGHRPSIHSSTEVDLL